MRLSSIDDTVEHWIFDASLFLARVQQQGWRARQHSASHRRMLRFLAYIAISFLLSPLVLFAVVLVPLLIGTGSTSIQRVVSGERT
jgi:hypothetical protein